MLFPLRPVQPVTAQGFRPRLSVLEPRCGEVEEDASSPRVFSRSRRRRTSRTGRSRISRARPMLAASPNTSEPMPVGGGVANGRS